MVERLMKIHPDQRYQSAGAVHADATALLADLEGNGRSAACRRWTNPATVDRSLPTVLCIEHRLKQQDIIRDYLSKRGFRVLLFNDVRRALSRLQTGSSRLRRA